MRRSLAAIAYAGLWAGAQSCGAGPKILRPSDPSVAVMGRVDRSEPDRLRMGYPGVTLRVRFEGPALYLRASSTTAASRLEVTVDGGAPRVVAVPRAEGGNEPEIALVTGLPAGVHTVDVVHRTETWQGVVTVAGFRLAPGGRPLPPPPWPARRLLLIGDSVTCGEAIDRPEVNGPDCLKDSGTWDPMASYGMVLGRALDAQVHLVCYGGRGLIRDWRGKTNVLNAPQFFDLAVPDEHRTPRWDHAAYVPDAVIVSLGTNDFNFDIGDFPAREQWVAAYVTFARAIRARYPHAAVFLTEGAIVHDRNDDNEGVENDNNDGRHNGNATGRPQRTVLRAYIDDVVRLAGVPWLHAIRSEHYPGDACNPHPTRAQHAAMARDLEPEIRRALGW